MWFVTTLASYNWQYHHHHFIPISSDIIDYWGKLESNKSTNIYTCNLLICFSVKLLYYKSAVARAEKCVTIRCTHYSQVSRVLCFIVCRLFLC